MLPSSFERRPRCAPRLLAIILATVVGLTAPSAATAAGSLKFADQVFSSYQTVKGPRHTLDATYLAMGYSGCLGQFSGNNINNFVGQYTCSSSAFYKDYNQLALYYPAAHEHSGVSQGMEAWEYW